MYDNYEAMNGIPDGTLHVPIKGIKHTCKQMDIDWAEAVVDFDYSSGFPVPVLLGVIVHEKDALNLVRKHRELRKEARRKKVEKERKMIEKLWRDAFKSVYIKFQFEG